MFPATSQPKILQTTSQRHNTPGRRSNPYTDLKILLIDDEIEEDTCNYLVPHHSRPARFYILSKIHKNKDNPPGRPIVSAFFHPTECISEFVDYQLNPLVPNLPSYIKDTTHFLQKLDSLPELANGCLLVTLDVSSLYTNIPHKEGIHACRKVLESNTNTRLKTESICDLIRMILTMNNFEFENNYYLQLHGTAMGTKMAPAYANLSMGDLEQNLLAQSPLKPLVWWRYKDDIFMIWFHGKEKLSEFVNLLNSSHETIKFTHEVSPSKINFLDVTVLLHNNNITTDLHVKSTDTHQYLLSSSCHPNHTKSQSHTALRIDFAVSAPPMTILNNALMNFWNFSVNAVTKETTSKHKSTELSMSHVKTLSTINKRNTTIVLQPKSSKF